MFVVKNKNFSKTNSESNKFNKRYNHELHIAVANYTLLQHAVW